MKIIHQNGYSKEELLMFRLIVCVALLSPPMWRPVASFVFQVCLRGGNEGSSARAATLVRRKQTAVGMMPARASQGLASLPRSCALALACKA